MPKTTIKVQAFTMELYCGGMRTKFWCFDVLPFSNWRVYFSLKLFILLHFNQYAECQR